MAYLHCRIPIPIPTRTAIQMATLYHVGTFHTAWTWIQIPIPTVTRGMGSQLGSESKPGYVNVNKPMHVSQEKQVLLGYGNLKKFV